jgi:ATP-dependent Clp protease adaptor protein ClpS
MKYRNITIQMTSVQMTNLQMAAGDNGDPSDDGGNGRGPGSGTQTLVRPKAAEKVQEPSFYKVLLLNDDFTPMDFVIHVLQKFFAKNSEEATQIMLQVHHQGSGVAGVFTHEVAETKTYLVNDYAKKNKHPLKAAMEKN